jgi:ribonuclease HI
VNEDRPEVTIHTDGGARPNRGVGGWAVILIFKDQIKELCGCKLDTTNQQMELTAAIEALNALKEPYTVTLYSDSEYVIKGINDWIFGWINKGWKNSNKKPVANQELWQALHEARQHHQVNWQWVKGHADNKYNIRADQLVWVGRSKCE